MERERRGRRATVGTARCLVGASGTSNAVIAVAARAAAGGRPSRRPVLPGAPAGERFGDQTVAALGLRRCACAGK